MKNVVAVRWLGAFEQSEASLIESAKWELKAEREVAFAYMHPNGRPVGNSYVGLLVDIHKSSIRARFLGDAYTEVGSDGTLYKSGSYKVRVKKGQTPKLARVKSEGGRENNYDEAVGVLSYLGVVVHHTASKKQRQLAIKIAEATGLPYLGSLTSSLKPVFSRPQKRKSTSGPRVCPVKRFRNLKGGITEAKAVLEALGIKVDRFDGVDSIFVTHYAIAGDKRLSVHFTPVSVEKKPDSAIFQIWCLPNVYIAQGTIKVTPEGKFIIEVTKMTDKGRDFIAEHQASFDG